MLADSGPLYAMRDPDDERHTRARAELLRIGEQTLTVAVPYPVLLESYTLVMRKLGLSQAQAYLVELEHKYPFVLAEREDHQGAARTIKRYPDQDITLVDAVLHELSLRLDVGVWTHDHHLDTLGAQVWR